MERAQIKARAGLNADAMPVHSFATMLDDLATIVRNRYRARDGSGVEIETVTTPTALQQQALNLLAVRV